MNKYTHLSYSERAKIEAYLHQSMSISSIASLLGRSRSTIYKELERNQTSTGYNCRAANWKYLRRRNTKPLKLTQNHQLRNHVISKLKLGWSPEQISGRLRYENKNINVCAETIYQFIYRNTGMGLWKYLESEREKRYRKAKRRIRCVRIAHKNISKRPIEVESRCSLGHWEGDTIRFRCSTKKSVTTLVERKSRLVKLIANTVSTSTIVMGNISNLVAQSNKIKWETITFDQGSEFLKFYHFENETKCKVFYANIKSPWQRGTNENTNRRLRKYLPRNILIEHINNDRLSNIEDIMNTTPRKCLGYKTPIEVFLNNE